MSDRPFRPIRILDIDLDRALVDIPMHDPKTNIRYGGVYCLVRSGGEPIGVVEFPVAGKVLKAEKLATMLLDPSRAPTSTRPRRMRPDTNEPFVSVVVATHDRADSLARCLDSLLLQTYNAFDIVVVDNAPSSSATQELISQRYAQRGNKVRYVREDTPGLGRAHNAGIAKVTAPVAVFTDDDVIADPGWVAAMAQNFDAAGKVGCVTGLILPAELETRAQYWTERHGGFGKGFRRKVFDLKENRPSGPLFPFTAGQFGSGANMAFSMQALHRIGGFDPALGAGTLARGGDDLASFYAAVQAGFQLVYEPSAIVWHHHRRGEEGMQRQAFGYGMGLGAYLTKTVIDDPAAAFRLAKALPAGLVHMAGPSSPKNQRLPYDYPTALIWRERLGIAAGVPNYLRSRAAARRSFKEPTHSINRQGTLDTKGTTVMGASVPILLYHSIDTQCTEGYRRWMMLPQELDRHMRVLVEGGYHPVTISALATLFRERRPLPPRTIAITFDDGLHDFLTGAMPVLERHGFAATLYVVSGLVGKTSTWLASLGEGNRRMLDWADLRSIACEGIEIGAHTVSHPQLDILPASQAAGEIQGSKSKLEHGLKRPVSSFAYPHGYSSRTTRALVRGAGFQSACRVRHAFTSTVEDPFTLSRIVMTSEVGPAELRQMLTQPVLPVAPPADRLVASGWRMVRRFQHLANPTSG